MNGLDHKITANSVRALRSESPLPSDYKIALYGRNEAPF